MNKKILIRPDCSMLPPAKSLRDLKEGKPMDCLPDRLVSFLLALKRQGLRLVCRRNLGQ
mgnify:CR=1 FL=1